MNKGRPLITAEELDAHTGSGESFALIDARSEDQYLKDHIDAAICIPQADLRNSPTLPDKNATTVVYCNRGVTGNAAQNILINKGFKKVYNLSGGHMHYRIMHPEKEG